MCVQLKSGLSLIPQETLKYEWHQELSYLETRGPAFGTLW